MMHGRAVNAPPTSARSARATDYDANNLENSMQVRIFGCRKPADRRGSTKAKYAKSGVVNRMSQSRTKQLKPLTKTVVNKGELQAGDDGTFDESFSCNNQGR